MGKDLEEKLADKDYHFNDKELVELVTEVANIIYEGRGYERYSPEFKYWESQHPQELQAWDTACRIVGLFRCADALGLTDIAEDLVWA